VGEYPQGNEKGQRVNQTISQGNAHLPAGGRRWLDWLIPAAVASLLGGVVNAWLFLVKVTS
jgi:hypothetical protein